MQLFLYDITNCISKSDIFNLLLSFVLKLITIDGDIISALDNEELSSTYESLLSLQNSLEVEGFTCSNE